MGEEVHYRSASGGRVVIRPATEHKLVRLEWDELGDVEVGAVNARDTARTTSAVASLHPPPRGFVIGVPTTQS